MGEVTPGGETGDMPFGVCEVELPFDSVTTLSASVRQASEPFLDFAPNKLFFCLNFSSQLGLLILEWLSELPTVVAKKRAFSLMISSVILRPCRWWFLAQFERARSMSGNFPFDLLTGDLLPSSG